MLSFLSPISGTQNFNGHNVFDLVPSEGTICAGQFLFVFIFFTGCCFVLFGGVGRGGDGVVFVMFCF